MVGSPKLVRTELLAKDGKYAAMWNAEQQFRIFDMNRFTNLDANGNIRWNKIE